MSNILDPLVLDFVEWVAKEPRPYAEVIDAWRTSCPRLTVWEDAVDRGFVVRRATEGQGTRVEVTEAGRRFLRKHRLSNPLAPVQAGTQSQEPDARFRGHERKTVN